jgi:hypothetical protein
MSRIFAKFQFLAPAQKPAGKPTTRPGLLFIVGIWVSPAITMAGSIICLAVPGIYPPQADSYVFFVFRLALPLGQGSSLYVSAETQATLF